MYTVRITGLAPIIHHNGAAGLDIRSPANIEKADLTKKRGSNRTSSDYARIQELECQTALWLNNAGEPTIPAGAIRSAIETGARKLKQGAQVREGLVFDSLGKFEYNEERYGRTVAELSKSTQFVTAVVVQRARILRTRAKFDLDWAFTFTLDVDDSLVDKEHLVSWLNIAGRRIGLGDWRPEKSGEYGRFQIDTIDTV